jgi:transcriptional regulator with GAF, ATPase, and Fis domain/predicted Ser/Thr protein kinase
VRERESEESRLDAPPRYEPIRKLGAGGGGEVWEVRCRLTNARLALKVIGGHSGQREADALVREVVALSGLEGLGLPRILRLGKLPRTGRAYVVRELVEGKSLDAIAAKAPKLAMTQLAEVAEQLTVLHRSGLLHGDIKPANIIADTDGSVTLVDFGLAAQWKEGGVNPEGLTPRYAAPELMRGGALTVRAEIYSLGAVLSELVETATEQLGLSDAQTNSSDAQTNSSGAQTNSSDAQTNSSDAQTNSSDAQTNSSDAQTNSSDAQTNLVAISRVAKQATAFDPGQRYPSTDEFAAELRSALGLRGPAHALQKVFPWPIRGLDATYARLFGAVTTLAPGAALCLLGEPGAGRTVLLHRLAFSLGIAGHSLVWLDELASGNLEMALLELDGITEPSGCYCLVDDAEQLAGPVLERLTRLRTSGVRLVTVGQVGIATDAETFLVPALDPAVLSELVRGAVPSVPVDVTEKLIELSAGRPGRLRQLVTKVAKNTVVCATDLEQLLAESTEGDTATLSRLERAVRLLDKGRFRDAKTILDEGRDTEESHCIEWVIAEARLLLGLGESARAKALLLLVLDQHPVDGHSPGGRAFQICLARAHLGQGDYEAAVRAADLVPRDGSALAIEAHAQKALALAYLGQNAEARALLEALMIEAETLDEPRLRALIGVSMGLLAQREDRHEDAFVDYRRALEAGKRSQDAGLLATTQLNLAGLLKVRGDLAGAIEHFEAALDLGQRIGRISTVRSALLNLSNLDLYLGRLARARARIDELSRERRSLPAIIEAQLCGREAEYFAHSGQAPLAVERYEACAKAYEQLGRQIEAADALLEGVLVACRAPQPSIEKLRVHLEHARGLLGNSTAHRTMLTLAIGRVSAVAGDESAARTSIDQAIEAARTNRQKEWLWRALEARAELEEQLGRRLRARRDREDALSVLEEIGSELPRDLREVYWNDPRRSSLRAVAASGTSVSVDAARMTGLEFGYGTSPKRDLLGTETQARDVSTMLSTPLEMRLAKILEINAELAGELSLERLTAKVTGHAMRLVRAERGLVLLRDESGKISIYCAKETGPADHHLRFSKTVAETVLNTGEPVVSVNARDDQRMSGWGSVHELMLQSVACVPIRDRSRKAIGALYLETRLARGSEFANELPMLQAFADQVAIAIQNTRLVSENLERARALEESNGKLVEAQTKLEELLGNRTAQLERTRRKLRETRDTLLGHFGYHGLVGTSAAMRRVYALVERVKDTDVPVLITGESGTGKEMVARAIHDASIRSKRSFVGVNCGAIPENLLESELFGCVRGAFTGADRDRKGLFRESEGGTILLDEIGEMPQKMQTGLLRVLQERKLRPVGGTQEESVDVRLVFATHRDLTALVEERRFREDLYYRIHVVPIRVPPLRERTEDIPQLVDHFLGIFAAKHRREKKTISRDALRLLMDQPWRGNVRELEHVLLNVWVMSDEEELRVPDFEVVLGQREPFVTPVIRSSVPPGTEPPKVSTRRRSSEETTERERILQALSDCGQNRVKAAQLLGIPRRTFYRRLRDYNIE